MFEEAQYTQTSALQTQEVVNDTRYFEVVRNNVRGAERSDFFGRSSHQISWTTDEKEEYLNSAELLVKCLEVKKVRFVFGQLGEHRSLLHQALHQSSIQFVPTRHSRDAAAMAHVHSRLTGQVGVCLATSMQSILNSLSVIAEANLNNIPLIFITEQVISDHLSIHSQENLNLNTIISPATQWGHQISHPEDTPKIVHKAFVQAEIGTDRQQPGAIHIHLPATTAVMSISASPIYFGEKKTVIPNAERLNQAAKWIKRVAHPILLAGSGAIQPEVRRQVIKLATQLDIPLANTVMAKGIIPEAHPLALGTVVSPKDHKGYKFDWADLVITVGCNTSECHPQDWNPDGDLPTLHISQSLAEITPYYHPTLELVGSLSEILGTILNQTNRQDNYEANYLKGCTTDSAAPYQQTNNISIPYKPEDLVQSLRTALKPDDILFSDTGIHRERIIRDYRCELPNKCLLFHKSASTGLVLSGAIAAKLVHPQNNVLAVTSADGFMKSYAALEPAQWLKTPFVTLICNPGGYYPNFIEIAKSMGFQGYGVTNSDELLPIVKDALTQKVPIVIDCPMDY